MTRDPSNPITVDVQNDGDYAWLRFLSNGTYIGPVVPVDSVEQGRVLAEWLRLVGNKIWQEGHMVGESKCKSEIRKVLGLYDG